MRQKFDLKIKNEILEQFPVVDELRCFWDDDGNLFVDFFVGDQRWCYVAREKTFKKILPKMNFKMAMRVMKIRS